MPYSEFHQMTKGKLESTQSKMTNYSDLTSAPDHEFVELLWENGQIVMQGQSSRTRKSSLLTASPPQASKVQEKDSGDAVIPKMGRYGNLESVLNDFSSSGPSSHVGLEQDDEMVPWLNYHIADSLQNDYCLDFFSDLSGTNLNPPSEQINTVPVDRNSSFGQVVRDSRLFSVSSSSNLEHRNTPKVLGGDSEPTRFRSSQFFPSLQQSRPSGPNQKARVSDFTANNNNNTTHQSHCGNLSHMPISAALNAKTPKRDSPSGKPLQPNNNMGLMNFSHFSRPVALVKANLQSIGDAAAGSLGIDRLRGSSEKASVTGSSPNEPSVVESTSGLKGVSGALKVNLKSSSKPLEEPVSVNQSEAICHEDAPRNKNSRLQDDILCQSSSFAESVALGRAKGEKAFGPVVASSSVCSGSSGPKHEMKRKSRDAEECGYQSEDVEDESVDVRKPTKGPKRSRAAAVHNLSERRRRDRINEKMRVLQELIPNCNKVDKASMLDEAIEYLKTLQRQVQIMSMGSGLCMSPMMLPPGMHQIRTPHMTHFSPMGTGMGMGVGMGMGMGYGMGMVDMGCSSSYPLIPLPSMHRTQFPCSPIPGCVGLHGLPGSSLQMFGIPGQGLPLSLPRAPYIPLSGFSTQAVMASDVLGAAFPSQIPDSSLSLPSSLKDQIQDINLQPMNKMNNDCSQIQTSTQVSEECLEQCNLGQRNDQTLHVNDPAAINTVGRNRRGSSGATSCD